MKKIWPVFACLFSFAASSWSQQPSASLSMVSPENRVILKVADGAITPVTVNVQAVPLDRVKLEGSGLKVIDAQRAVIGSMAQLPQEGPGSIEADRSASHLESGGVYGQPQAFRNILNNRELSVLYDGQPVPANRIVMDQGELRIFNSTGDLLRIIPADSSRLAKRGQ